MTRLSPGRVRGLSPCVRGNPGQVGHLQHPRGSIPVCTGEPVALNGKGPIKRVYPRVYGGTMDFLSVASTSSGLSPRVRGEPSKGRRPYWSTGVYPRVYGGTSTEFIRLFAAMSLFPGV